MNKRNTYQRKNQRQPAHIPSRAPWLFILLLCGCLGGGLFYLYQQGTFTKQDYFQKLTKRQSAKVKEPQFEFYNILPDMKMPEAKPAVDAAPKKMAPKEIKKAPALATNKQYYIQVAAFPQFKEADHLKAALTLSGHQVQIKAFEKDKKQWFRVVVGPYTNQPQAKQAQQTLQKQKINSFIISLNDTAQH